MSVKAATGGIVLWVVSVTLQIGAGSLCAESFVDPSIGGYSAVLPGQDVAENNCMAFVYDSDGTHTVTDADMRYRLFVPPDYNPAIKYPVIMTLHGLGAEGNNNLDQLLSDKEWVLQLINNANRYKYPCIFIAPQRQTGEWYGGNYNSVFGIISDVAAQYSIDRSRIYLTGVSYGSFGTFAFLAHRSNSDPFHWAAGVPISGDGDHNNAWQYPSTLAGIPMWVFHAKDDNTVNIYDQHGSDVMIDLIRQAGGSPMYTRYNTGNHTPNTWGCAYATPTIVSWLMSQRLDNESVSSVGRNETTWEDPGVVLTGYRVGSTLSMEGTLSAAGGSPTEVSFWNSTIAPVRSGTATLTGSSTTVTFSGESFTAADVNRQLFLKNSAFETWNGYVITAVTNSTVIKVVASNTGKGIGNGTFSSISYDINPPGYRLFPQVVSGTSSWSVSGVVLTSGVNVIGLTGKGSSYPTLTQSGNTFYGGSVVTITYSAPSGDTVAPVLTVSSPSSGPVIITPQSSLTLSGTTSDDQGVTAVTWISDHGGSGTASGTTNWTAPSIALDPGNNIVTVKARDNAGNIAVKILRVMCNTAPIAATVSATTQKDAGVTVDVLSLATDTDSQPQILSVSTIGVPFHGTASVYGSRIRYAPSSGYSGSDSVSYVITDGVNTASGQINIQVSGTLSNSGATYFSQDFSAGTDLSVYTSSTPNSGQFNDISAEASGGTVTVTNGALVFNRPAVSSGSSNASGITRYTDLSGTPQFVKVSMDFSVTNVTNSSGLLDFELGNITSKTDYSSNISAATTLNRLSFTGKGVGVMALKLSGLASDNFNSDGTTHHLDWYVNATSGAKQYVGPDGFLYQVSGYSASVWMDGVSIWNDVTRTSTFAATTLTDFRLRSSSTSTMNFIIDNLSITEQNPLTVADILNALQSWRQTLGLSSDGSQDLQSPAGDGISNLLKFALNMASNTSSLSQPAYPMASGGTSGLPHLVDQGNGTLSFAFVRRKSSTSPGISYVVEQSNDLQTWSAYTQTPLIESIDSTWERATFTLDPDTAPHSFLRLKVTTP